MSFAEKITGLMARPGEDPVAKDDISWWMKAAGRGLGTFAGFLAILLGLLNATSIMFGNVSCLIGGLWQMLAGFLLIVCEAPCCCKFVDFVQNLSDWVENRPNWNKAAIYVAIAIPPVFMCFSLSSLFGCGLIFATGVIYGMMALGKKASAEDMRSAAAAQGSIITPNNLQPPSAGASSNTRSNLVENAVPISFTSAPSYDSNV